MGAEEIQNSASRSVTGMLEMQAGVTVTNGDLHIRGSREEEVAYTIDGADIKDVVYSGRMASAIPEALSEIAVEAGGYGAHIGGANSGVVRQTLRTGGSSFGGSARLESGDYGPGGVVVIIFVVQSVNSVSWQMSQFHEPPRARRSW